MYVWQIQRQAFLKRISMSERAIRLTRSLARIPAYSALAGANLSRHTCDTRIPVGSGVKLKALPQLRGSPKLNVGDRLK